MPKRVELHRHCRCGASWYFCGSLLEATLTQELWQEQHSGAGHAVVTRGEAAKVRAREEARLAREEDTV